MKNVEGSGTKHRGDETEEGQEGWKKRERNGERGKRCLNRGNSLELDQLNYTCMIH